MAGRLVSVVSPGASRAAAISFSTLFFAPTTATSPASRAPPVTLEHLHRARLAPPAHRRRRTRLSASARHGRASDPHLHQDRRRRHDRARRHVPGAPRPTRGWARTPTATRRTPRSASRSRSAGCPTQIAARAAAGSRTTCSTSAPTCARRSCPTRPTRRCGSPTPTSTGSRAGATSSTPTLPKLDSFILPGGTAGAALLHQARTVARRAERSAWALYEADPDRTNRDGAALPEPALGPAVHPGPGRQSRTATCCGSPAASTLTPAEPQLAASRRGQDAGRTLPARTRTR